MAYLVFNETKKHRVLKFPDRILAHISPKIWSIVECDADGWIPWNGDETCPLPEGADVEIKGIDDAGSFRLRTKASDDLWSTEDIIAYRPVLDQPTRSTTMEPNLAEQIVAAATNQEVTESVFAANNTPAFREAVRRLKVCRETLVILGNLYEVADGQGNYVDQRVIDRARAAVGLPTAVDKEIAETQARLNDLKTQREEMLK